MSTDVSAVLIYGLPYDELGIVESGDEDVYYQLEEYDSAYPYFDAPFGEGIFGVVVCGTRDFCSMKLPPIEQLTDSIEIAKRKFKEKSGKEGRLYLSPHVL